MEKKLDELKNPPKDPNSPESQEFLRKLHKDLIEGTERFRQEVEKWKEEDRRNETK